MRPTHGTRTTLLRDLAAIAGRLGDDELAVLVTLATPRAWAGQARYGCLDLHHDRRDFHRETFEEIADGLFYLGAALQRRRARMRATRRRATCTRGSDG